MFSVFSASSPSYPFDASPSLCLLVQIRTLMWILVACDNSSWRRSSAAISSGVSTRTGHVNSPHSIQLLQTLEHRCMSRLASRGLLWAQCPLPRVWRSSINGFKRQIIIQPMFHIYEIREMSDQLSWIITDPVLKLGHSTWPRIWLILVGTEVLI